MDNEILQKDYQKCLQKLDKKPKDKNSLTVIQKAGELVEKVAKEHKIPTTKSTDTFSDGIKMGSFWNHCKREDWKENNQEAFKLLMSQEILQHAYHKYQQKRNTKKKHLNSPTPKAKDTFKDS